MPVDLRVNLGCWSCLPLILHKFVTNSRKAFDSDEPNSVLTHRSHVGAIVGCEHVGFQLNSAFVNSSVAC